MSKSFDDQELSDIMKEIEALEENFQSGEEKAEPSSVMEEFAELSEDKVLPEVKGPKKAAQVLPLTSQHVRPGKNSATSMNFKVCGDLNLEMQFDIGGKVVSLEVNEGGLSILMEGGVTFSIPLKKSA